MNTLTTNFFEIENPEAYACTVWRFQIAHSQLLLSVYLPGGFMSESNHYFLLFGGVEYFEGPIHWESANFVIASNEECSELLGQIHTDWQAVKENFRLFKVKAQNQEIKILAGKNSARKFGYKDAPKHWLGSMGNIQE